MLEDNVAFYVDWNALHGDSHIGFETETDTLDHLTGYAKNTQILLGRNVREYPEQHAIRQSVSVENRTKETVCLSKVASVYVKNIGSDGEKSCFDGRFIVHYAKSAWQGEGRWMHFPLEKTGVYSTFNHFSWTFFCLRSVGSWSTEAFLPVLFLEDTEQKKTWFFEAEGGHGWSIEISTNGMEEKTTLCVCISDADERNDGWFQNLAPGETFTTSPAVFGCVDGGFEEAVASLHSVQRSEWMQPFGDGQAPLCFNDYMNCLWANPSREKLFPLIEAAASVGCEYFVIDAGWFSDSGEWNHELGDWLPCDRKFGEGGLQAVLDKIREEGMLPGVWFEVESLGIHSDFAKKHPEALLTRHGFPVGAPRGMADFRQSMVRQHVRDRISHLYHMGVRYVKNDYNQTTGIGIDGKSNSISANLHEHDEAVLLFWDEIRKEFPDLLIENCGSGAMRADFGTVRHFDLQSVSDQEDYFRMPSILSGMGAFLPPERLGIWSYTFDSPYSHRLDFVPTDAWKARFSDGRITVFNTVNGLMGTMYLSGHINCADELNLRLLAEGSRLFKKYRELIPDAVPIYPTGTFGMEDKGVFAYGLLHRIAGKLMLAVWSIGDKKQGSIDLTKYGSFDVETSYPALLGYAHHLKNGVLNVSFPSGMSAMYIVFNLKSSENI